MFQNEVSWYILGAFAVLSIVAAFARLWTRRRLNGFVMVGLVLTMIPVAVALSDGGISWFMAGLVLVGILLLVLGLAPRPRREE